MFSVKDRTAAKGKKKTREIILIEKVFAGFRQTNDLNLHRRNFRTSRFQRLRSQLTNALLFDLTTKQTRGGLPIRIGRLITTSSLFCALKVFRAVPTRKLPPALIAQQNAVPKGLCLLLPPPRVTLLFLSLKSSSPFPSF